MSRRALAALAVAAGLGAAGLAGPAHAQDAATATSTPGLARVEADIARFDAEIAALRASFAAEPAAPDDKDWVKRKLAHMVDVDQRMRRLAIAAGKDAGYSVIQLTRFQALFGPRARAIDRQNTDDLKALLERYDWFTISAFGEKADKNAWLLVQHADHDRAFQERVLEGLTRLTKTRETDRSNYAYLYDRVAVGADRKQRFGTQLRKTLTGRYEPFPLQAPDQVDALRRWAGLGPLADYVEDVNAHYGGR